MVVYNLTNIIGFFIVGTGIVWTIFLCQYLKGKIDKIERLLETNFSYYEGGVEQETVSAFDEKIMKMKEELASYTADAREVRVVPKGTGIYPPGTVVDAQTLHPLVFNIPTDEADKERIRIEEGKEEYAE